MALTFCFTMLDLVAASAQASIRLVDSSIPYDSSVWRGVKAALWKWRKPSMLQKASEVWM